MAEKIKPNVSALILAAGVGSRMGSKITKQRMNICEKTVLAHTLAAFERAETVSFITVVIKENELDFAKKELKFLTKPYSIVFGGDTRLESAKMGFESLSDNCEFVAIHDCARCLVTPEIIDAVAKAAYTYGAASAAMKVVDTVKRVDSDGFIISTENRDALLRASTPQIFKKSIYKSAMENAENIKCEITDDNMLVEKIDGRIMAVVTDNTNIKVTEPSDILLAEKILEERNKKVRA